MDFRQKIDITCPLHPSLKLFMMKIRITTVHLKFGCISEISGAVSMDGHRRLGARVSGDPDSAARLSGPGDREILHAVGRSTACRRKRSTAAGSISCKTCGFSLVYLPAGLCAAAAGG